MPRTRVALLSVLVALGAGSLQAQNATEYPSSPIPAFTADELTALPTTNWIANPIK